VVAQARGIGRASQRRFRVQALEWASGQAASARPARLHEGPDYVIPDVKLRNLRADARHDPSDLVPEHSWPGNDVVVGEQQIGVTETRGLHVYEDFAPDGSCEVYVLEVETTTECVEYHRLHMSRPYRPKPLATSDSADLSCHADGNTSKTSLLSDPSR